MQNFLIECFENVIIYATETNDGDVEIKFIEYTHLPDSFSSPEILKYRDFRFGYNRLGKFEAKTYGDILYCRIYANLYKIDIPKRTYEVIESDFCGICFMKDYILLAKDEENFYKLTPSVCKKVSIN